jgi:tRNA (adenine37-N6)-methyltransferase
MKPGPALDGRIMVRLNEIRRNEVAVEAPSSFDAGLVFIDVIRTPWTSRLNCPRQGRADGPVCRIEVAEPWVKALDGIEACERIEVLYWLHESRRDLVRQSAQPRSRLGGLCDARPCGRRRTGRRVFAPRALSRRNGQAR